MLKHILLNDETSVEQMIEVLQKVENKKALIKIDAEDGTNVQDPTFLQETENELYIVTTA